VDSSTPSRPAPTKAVFFDVDFTLIYPGPTFQASGYREFCARHGIDVDSERFDEAVASAASLLDEAPDSAHDPQLFLDYTSRIIEHMGGRGPSVRDCAREIYDEWAACQHFSLYEEVPAVLQQLHARGLRIGLISNTHRCLTAFQSHFELDGLISATVSSSLHGFMKPHPSIFEAALKLVAVSPNEAVMVGDSLRHDAEGALRIGMRAVLLCRSRRAPVVPHVPVIRTLTELPAYL
jgi:HAD superfamily hydrolase (TIGR01509 family)